MSGEDSEQMDAREILKRLQESDAPRLFERIVDLTLGYVYGLALWATRDLHGADEVTQEVFLALRRQYPSIHDPDKLYAWLYGTTIRCAKKFYRASRKKAPHDLRYVLLSRMSGKYRGPLEQLVDAESRLRLARDLDAALSTLSPAERQCLELAFQEEMDAPDIARRMGIKVETVYSYRARALKKLSSIQSLRKWL